MFSFLGLQFLTNGFLAIYGVCIYEDELGNPSCGREVVVRNCDPHNL
jgi:hypothetical protein